jgi:hypothetical protein
VLAGLAAGARLGLELGDHALRFEEEHEPRVMIHLDVTREKTFERHDHVLRTAPTIAWLFLEALVDDVCELAWNLGIHGSRTLVLLETDLVHRRFALVLDEGLLARDHLIEHDTEGEDVAARVELVAENLLGRHVRGRADASACFGEIAEIRVARDAEVHHLHAAGSRDHDVCGLDVAMHDAAVVHVVECTRDLHADDRSDVVRKTTALLEEVVQVDALHVLHHDEHRAALAMEVVDVDDVLVLQIREALRFAFEARHDVFFCSCARFERLDCHSASKRVLHRAIDDGHASAGHLFHDPAISDALEHGSGPEFTVVCVRNAGSLPTTCQGWPAWYLRARWRRRATGPSWRDLHQEIDEKAVTVQWDTVVVAGGTDFFSIPVDD